MKYLPSPSTPLPKDADPISSPASLRSSDVSAETDLRMRLYPVRLVAISVLSVALGVLLGLWLLPLLPDGTAEDILYAHLPALDKEALPVSLPLQFVRLCASVLPCLLILGIAGLTCFCRGVSTLMLSVCGICEGCGLYLLLSLTTEHSSPHASLPAALSLLWAVYGARMLLLLGTRLLIALSSAHLSNRFFDPDQRLADGQRGISPLLARHLLLCLAGVSAAMLTCGGYLLVIHFWHI